MYIKDDKANAKALAELDILMDLDARGATEPVQKEIKKYVRAISRYETWRYDDGAPRRWQLTQRKLAQMGWKRPKPLYDPKQTNHERLLNWSKARRTSFPNLKPTDTEKIRKIARQPGKTGVVFDA